MSYWKCVVVFEISCPLPVFSYLPLMDENVCVISGSHKTPMMPAAAKNNKLRMCGRSWGGGGAHLNKDVIVVSVDSVNKLNWSDKSAAQYKEAKAVLKCSKKALL